MSRFVIGTLLHELEETINRTREISEEIQKRVYEGDMNNFPPPLPAEAFYDILNDSCVLTVEIFPSDPIDDPLIVFISETLEKLFGYRKGELEYKPLSTIIPDESKENHKRFIKEFQRNPQDRIMGVVLDGGSPHRLNVTGQTKDKKRFPLIVHLKTRDVKGRTYTTANVMIVGPATDPITDKLMQEHDNKENNL